jgi:hypothetical protein
MSLRERTRPGLGTVAAGVRGLGVVDLQPEECRKRALECVRKAQLVTGPLIRSMFAELAQHWTEMAADLENIERLRS